jgi:hypothetical protein
MFYLKMASFFNIKKDPIYYNLMNSKREDKIDSFILDGILEEKGITIQEAIDSYTKDIGMVGGYNLDRKFKLFSYGDKPGKEIFPTVMDEECVILNKEDSNKYFIKLLKRIKDITI